MFVAIYLVTFVILLILSVVMMAKGFTALDYTKPKRRIHPEMVDVKEGDELMGVTFNNSDEMNDDFNRRVKQLEEK